MRPAAGPGQLKGQQSAAGHRSDGVNIVHNVRLSSKNVLKTVDSVPQNVSGLFALRGMHGKCVSGLQERTFNSNEATTKARMSAVSLMDGSFCLQGRPTVQRARSTVHCNHTLPFIHVSAQAPCQATSRQRQAVSTNSI